VAALTAAAMTVQITL